MKKLTKLLLIAMAVIVLSMGSVITTASAAEVRPLFNYFASDSISYDAETGVYTVDGMSGGLPRLSAVDYQTYLLKTDYSDDVIKFDYRFTDKKTSLAGEDWAMYFTFRNFSGESPLWLTDYAAYLVFWKDYVIFELYYSNGDKMVFYDADGNVTVPKIDYPSITAMNADEEIVVVDKEWHNIEININDENGDVTIYRDKGQENEGVINVSTITEKGKVGILETGGYSFSTNQCSVDIKDLYFEDPDKTELDDEKGRYEEAQNSSEEGTENSESIDNTQKPAKKGCGSSVGASLALTVPALLSAAFVLRKKENNN